jgi:hypothetical protein
MRGLEFPGDGCPVLAVCGLKGPHQVSDLLAHGLCGLVQAEAEGLAGVDRVLGDHRSIQQQANGRDGLGIGAPRIEQDVAGL